MLQLMVRSAICGDRGRDGLVTARANPPLGESQQSVPPCFAIHVAATRVLATMNVDRDKRMEAVLQKKKRVGRS